MTLLQGISVASSDSSYNHGRGPNNYQQACRSIHANAHTSMRVYITGIVSVEFKALFLYCINIATDTLKLSWPLEEDKNDYQDSFNFKTTVKTKRMLLHDKNSTCI